MNNFKEIYSIIKTIKEQYESGNITQEQAQRSIADTYSSLEYIYSKDTPEYISACIIYRNYSIAMEDGNEDLDFEDCIFENQVENICKLLKENEIDRFTISSTYSGLTNLASKFQENGYYVTGLTQIKSQYTDFMSTNKKVVPAFVFKLKEK